MGLGSFAVMPFLGAILGKDFGSFQTWIGGGVETLPNFPDATFLYALLDQYPAGAPVQQRYSMTQSTAELAESGSQSAGFDMEGENLYTISLILSDNSTESGYVAPPSYTPSQYQSQWP